MQLFKSRGSTHVRLSDKASKLFQNSETGNRIIRTITEKKTEISSGKSVTISPDNIVVKKIVGRDTSAK